MKLLVIVIAACWIGCGLYWIVSAIGSKKGSVPNMKQFAGIRVAIVVLATVMALLFNKLPQSLKGHLLGTGLAVLATGFLLFLVGLLLAIWARVYLGRNWGMPMTQAHDSKLVITGPYGYVRHPIYSGILLMALGSAIDVNTYWLLVFVIAAVFFVYSAIMEEQLMLKQFPKVYSRYKNRTKMLVPFIF